MNYSRIVQSLTISAAVLFALGAPLSVQADEESDACSAIMSAVAASGSNVCVSINDGVATLSGYVNSTLEKVDAEKVARETEGVESVINLLSIGG